MILQHLHAENFLLLGNIDIDFQKGLTLISGDNRDHASTSNRSGKSSLPEAPTWCWYGQTIRNISATSVVHRKSEKPCLVTTTFKIKKHQYKITRTRGAGKYGMPSIKVEMDGSDITSAEKPQALIDSIIGLDYKAFVQVCVFAQNNRFRFTQLTNSEQKDIIESIIGFDRFDKYLGLVKEVQSDLTDKYVKQKELRTQMHERLLGLQGEELRVSRWLLEAENKNKSKAPETDIKKVKWDVGAATQEMNKLVAEKEKISGLLGGHREKLNSIKEKIDSLETTTKKTVKLVGLGKCPTCKQKIPNDFGKALLENNSHECDTLKGLERKEKKRLGKCIKEKDRFTNKILVLSSIIREGKESLEKVLSKTVDTTEFEKRLKAIKDERREAGNTKILAEQDMLRLERKSEHYGFLKSAFSKEGIESYLFDSLLPFLNEKANYYANELSDGGLTIRFATVKKNKRQEKYRDLFHIDVEASEGAESYGGCSGSEERWADLAVSLALRDLAEASGKKVPPILVLDEVSDTLDEVGTETLLKFLLKYAKMKTVWLISHNTEMKQHYDHKINLVREGGITSVAR